MSMPEVFYGFNHLYIANPEKDVLLEFSPAAALSLSAFTELQKFVKVPKLISTSSEATIEETLALKL